MLIKSKMKLGILFVFAVFFTMFFSSSAHAIDLGTLSYWYSDDSVIGRWDSSLNIITVYKQKLNSNSSFVFLDGITTACLNWDDVIGKQISSGQSSSFSSAQLNIFFGRG